MNSNDGQLVIDVFDMSRNWHIYKQSFFKMICLDIGLFFTKSLLSLQKS